MSTQGLTHEEYTEYAHHLRVAGQTVTADVIDDLLDARLGRLGEMIAS